MAQISWTDLSIEDLKSIYEHISKDSESYAWRLVEKITDIVEQLEYFPLSGRVVPEFENETIRELIEGNYRIVYKVKSSEQLAIARVHHSSRLLTEV
jgi:addiction module RelE/StbE family toxin